MKFSFEADSRILSNAVHRPNSFCPKNISRMFVLDQLIYHFDCRMLSLYFKIIYFLIAELAERSPIVIQNSSNPSSRKKFGCTTVRPYKVLLTV